MSVLDLARPELLCLKAYSSARMEAGSASVMLNANEAPAAPFDDDDVDINRYPQPQPQALLTAFARAYDVDSTQIFVGRGSDEAIDLLIRAFCRCGQDAILISPPTFGMYAVAAGVQGASIVSVPLLPEQGFALNLDAVLQAAEAAPVKLVFVCTPNNPTGAVVPREQILALVRALKGKALVVVDEAYVEFAPVASMTADVSDWPNLVVLRTLSKAYGLAGARVGSLIAAPQIVQLLRRIMAPYPLPSPSVAAALKVFEPSASAARARRVAQTIAERERVSGFLASYPAIVCVWPSAANFIAFRTANALRVVKSLADRGVILRDISHYLALNDCLRVSIGSPDENDQFMAALEDVFSM